MYFDGTVVARFVNERALRAVSGAVSGEGQVGAALLFGSRCIYIFGCRVSNLFLQLYFQRVGFFSFCKERGGRGAGYCSEYRCCQRCVRLVYHHHMGYLFSACTYVHTCILYVCLCVCIFVCCVCGVILFSAYSLPCWPLIICCEMMQGKRASSSSVFVNHPRVQSFFQPFFSVIASSCEGGGGRRYI